MAQSGSIKTPSQRVAEVKHLQDKDEISQTIPSKSNAMRASLIFSILFFSFIAAGATPVRRTSGRLLAAAAHQKISEDKDTGAAYKEARSEVFPA
ncbi:hypothetical protein B0F90DRAFT_1819663 [Multifurca ochricompacta]|uniref:Uncharacterized protein n=1 Tax=Multifurca ochricompacta TaxID=376703 RepID=A0AAD4QIX2_9AGAM|nr:hypothetical protein B0F90DRAFT_1819663 [Multifurca ochricompacta]